MKSWTGDRKSLFACLQFNTSFLNKSVFPEKIIKSLQAPEEPIHASIYSVNQ